MIVRPDTRAGLLALMDDRIDYLKAAGGQFDEGKPASAREMAACIRGLVHHTTSSPALINQLGLEREFTWVDTAGVTHPKTVTSAACLTLMKIGSGPHGHGEYIPKLDLYPPVPIRTRDGGRIDRGTRIAFDHWWTNPVVKDPDGIDYSRKQLVLALAHTQAGADDDADVNTAYRAVASSHWLGWVVSDWAAAASDGSCAKSAAFGANPLMASVRQIGYEVVQTFRQQRDLVEAACDPGLVSLSAASAPVSADLPNARAVTPDEPVPSIR